MAYLEPRVNGIPSKNKNYNLEIASMLCRKPAIILLIVGYLLLVF